MRLIDCMRTRDVQMTSRRFRFIQLSHFSRLPLYVSPLFSSTSCAGRRLGQGGAAQGARARHTRAGHQATATAGIAARTIGWPIAARSSDSGSISTGCPCYRPLHSPASAGPLRPANAREHRSTVSPCSLTASTLASARPARSPAHAPGERLATHTPPPRSARRRQAGGGPSR